MNTEIPPGFKITYCKPGTARGVEPNRCRSTGSKGAVWTNNNALENQINDTSVRLAKMKISQALLDLKNHNRKGEKAADRLKSESWIFTPTSDFSEWCETAGMHPDYVRRKAKKIIDKGQTWVGRAAPGTGKRYQERSRKKELRKKASEMFS